MKNARRRERKSFSKIDAQWDLKIPNLLEVQLKSFRDFLQMDSDPMRRRNEGLQEVFTGVFPISDARELFSLQIISVGFIVTSVLWSGMLTALLDRRLRQASGWCLVAAAFTLCGVIHSPFKDGRLFLPWAIGDLPVEAAGRGPLHLAVTYGLLALLFAIWPATPATTATSSSTRPDGSGTD